MVTMYLNLYEKYSGIIYWKKCGSNGKVNISKEMWKENKKIMKDFTLLAKNHLVKRGFICRIYTSRIKILHTPIII
jgi:hypothetical protein